MDDFIDIPTLQDAKSTVERALKRVDIEIHPSMAIFLAPSVFENSKNSPRRLLALPYVNHNVPSNKYVSEIQNKLLDNPTKTRTEHLDEFGRDMKWIVLKRTDCHWVSNNGEVDEKCSPLRVLGSSMSGAHDVFTGVQDYSDGGDKWVQRWLDDGGQKYCLIDSHTREGRLEIAKYHDQGDTEWVKPLIGDLKGKSLEEVWTEKEEQFEEDDEKLGVILYELRNLIDRRGDRCSIMVGCFEGQNRMVSMMTTSYGSYFDGRDGTIVPGSLSFHDLQHELRGEGDVQEFDEEDEFQRYIKRVLSKDPPPMMSTPVTIETFHFFNNDETIRDVFMCLEVISKKISDGKLHSARPPLSRTCNDILRKFTRKMTEGWRRLVFSPDMTEDHVKKIPMQVSETAFLMIWKNWKMEDKGSASAIHTENKELEEYISSIVTSQTYMDHLDDPTSRSYLDAVYGMLCRERNMNIPGPSENDVRYIKGKRAKDNKILDDEHMDEVYPSELYPPYLPTFHSTVYMKQKAHLTPELANSLLLIGPLSVALCAAVYGVTDDVAIQKAQAPNNYYAKYLLDPGEEISTMTALHPAYSVIHGGEAVRTIVGESSGILGAMLFLIRSVNICLGFESHVDSVRERKKGVMKGIVLVEKMVAELSMGGKSCDDGNAVMVLNVCFWLLLRFSDKVHKEFNSKKTDFENNNHDKCAKLWLPSLVLRRFVIETVIVIAKHGICPELEKTSMEEFKLMQKYYSGTALDVEEKRMLRNLKNVVSFHYNRGKKHQPPGLSQVIKRVFENRGKEVGGSLLPFFLMASSLNFEEKMDKLNAPFVSPSKKRLWYVGRRKPDLENRQWKRKWTCLAEDNDRKVLHGIANFTSFDLSDTGIDENLVVANISTLGLLTFEEKDKDYDDHTLIHRAKHVKDAYEQECEDAHHIQMFDLQKLCEEFTKAQGDKKKEEETKMEEQAEKRAMKKKEKEAEKTGALSSSNTGSLKRRRNDVIELDSDMSTDDSLEGPARKFVASSGKKKRERKIDVRSDADYGDAVSKHKEPREEAETSHWTLCVVYLKKLKKEVGENNRATSTLQELEGTLRNINPELDSYNVIDNESNDNDKNEHRGGGNLVRELRFGVSAKNREKDEKSNTSAGTSTTVQINDNVAPITSYQEVNHINTVEEENEFRKRCEGYVAPYAVEIMIGIYKAQQETIPGFKTFNHMQWVSKRHDSQDVEWKDFIFMLGTCHLLAFKNDDDEGLKSCDPVSRYARWIVKMGKIDKPLADMIKFANEFQAKPEMSADDLAAIDEFWRKEAKMKKGQEVRRILDECGKWKRNEDDEDKKGDANSEETNDHMQNDDNNNEGENVDKGGEVDKGARIDSESKTAQSPGGRRSRRLAATNAEQRQE